MNLIRLILLVVVLGGLMLLLAQNFSPAIPLVFLGLRTQPIALAIWMLLSVVAGALTSLLINNLVQFSGGYVTQERPMASYSPSDSPRDKQTSGDNQSYRQNSAPPPRDRGYENNYDDDWDLDKKVSDDWDFEEKDYYEEREYIPSRSRSQYTSSQYTKIQDDRDYEDFQEPQSDDKSTDSSYSYTKRDLKNYGVGKTESVYDADYRVIIPPANPSTTSNIPENSDDFDESDHNNDDDWGFLDEDFDDDKTSPPNK